MASIFVWPDGHIEQFIIGGDNALWHRWTTNLGGVGGWESLGGKLRKFCIATTISRKPEIFAIGHDDNETIHQWIDSAWSGWSPLGASMNDIDVASNSDGHLELFGIGNSKEVFHNWQNSDLSWSGWLPIGDGGVFNSIRVKRKGDKFLEVFARHDDGSVRHKWQSPAGWSDGWPSLDGNVTSFEVICNSSGFLELFGVFAGGEIKHRWQMDNGWSDDWASLGGNFIAISAGAFPDGTAQVVGSNVRGDVFVNRRKSDHSWSGWENDSPGEAGIVEPVRAIRLIESSASPQEKAAKAADLRTACYTGLSAAMAALVAGAVANNAAGMAVGLLGACTAVLTVEQQCIAAHELQEQAEASGQSGETGRSPDDGGICSAPAGATGTIQSNLDDNTCRDDGGD